MLEMRMQCEKCSVELHEKSDAYICVHECTYCPTCTTEMNHICMNCSGELVRRPKAGSQIISCLLSK
nr:DUF1272 domain-containing protein [Fictibacillus sp. 26RED30]